MAADHSSLNRLFAGRHFLKGKRRLVLFWSAIASLLVCLSLMNLLLIIDLLQTRGTITIPVNQAQVFDDLQLFPPAPEIVPNQNESQDDSSGEDQANSEQPEPAIDEPDRKENTPERINPTTERVRLECVEEGILPTIWWARNTLWRAPLSSLFRNVGMLQHTYPAIVFLVLSLMVLGLLHSLALGRLRALSIEMGFDVSSKLQRDLHRQVLRLGPADLNEAEKNHVLDLFTNHTEKIRHLVQNLVFSHARNPMQIGAFLLFALSIHWLSTLSSIIPLVACWYLVQQELVRFQSSRKILEANASASLRILSEGFKKARLVRAYNMEQVEQEHFQKHLDRYLKRASFVSNRERWSRWYCRILIMICASIVLLLICMKVLLSPEEMPLAAGICLLISFMALHWPMKYLFENRGEIKIVSHIADPVYRYLDKQPPVSQAVGAKFLPPLANRLSFESVSVELEGKKKSLQNFDLKISAGESVAIVSLDPASAKTAAYLVPRFIEPTEGRILIDGEDISWGTLESLRAEVAFVGGSELFFEGTIKDNISCGDKKLTNSDIAEAAKTTRAHNFILKLSQGYETLLGDRGEILNPGQAFRLGLARAIIRNPALLIIEEPTETLDSDTKALLEDTYNRVSKDRTVIFLPNRLSTVRRADRIVLIHNAEIESVGTHADLVKNSPQYRHWEYMHFNSFQKETTEVN